MAKRVLWRLFLCVLGVLPLRGWGQQEGRRLEAGLPFLQTFGVKDYVGEAQNWAVVQDKRGLLYVANSAGVLEYDATSWRLIVTGNQTGARSLAVDANGTVFVGAVGDFGYLAPDSVGRLGFVSLLGLVPEEDRQFADVWKCYATKDGVFFQTADRVFRFRANEPIRVWRAETRFDIAFAAYDRFFVRQVEVGLMEIAGDSLHLPPFGARFAQERVFAMFPLPADTIRKPICIVTRGAGLLRLDEGTRLLDMPFASAPFLIEHKVYHAIPLKNRRMAFATLTGGAIVTDLDGNVLQSLNKQTGLPDQQVYYLHTDHQQGLWLALNNGLARVEVQGPLSQYGETTGLAGSVSALARYKGQLYAATNLGVFQLNGGLPLAQFVPTSIAAPAWALLGTEAGLLVATEGPDSLCLLAGPGKPRRVAGYSGRSFLRSRDQQTVYVGLRDGLARLKWDGKTWKDGGRVEGLEAEVRSMVELENGALLLATFGQGLFRVQDPAGAQPVISLLNAGNELPQGNLRVFRAADRVLMQTVQGLYAYANDRNTFLPDTIFYSLLGGEVKQLDALSDYGTRGNLWVAGDRGFWLALRQPGGRYQVVAEQALKRVTQNVNTVEFIDHEGEMAGIVWEGGFDGLIRYDTQLKRPYTAPFAAYIRSVRQQLGRTDTLLFGGTYYNPDSARIEVSQHKSELRELPYNFGALRITYAANSFELPEATEYQIWLEGRDDDWGNWTRENRKDYTNLPEGNYVFHVRARNLYGHISEEASYAFVVLPPFYRTWWALLGYIGLAALFVYLFSQMRLKSIQREKRILEMKVDERTQELQLQKVAVEQANEEIKRQHESLEEAYHEIEEKNKDITDSIAYARRIQEALLPVSSELAKYLGEVFVLNRPRDIVSGDFYWYSRRRNPEGDQLHVLAVVDCTGHGVPGAFMSVMGNTLLNQIVNENGIHDPGAILNELDLRVRTLLRQVKTGGSAQSQDGMDVALVVIDPAEGIVRFAGARRPLYFYHQKDLKEFGGNKNGVGGQHTSEEPFTTIALKYQPGDALYLTSDGYADQFGGPNRRKFMATRMRELLLNVAPEPMPAQLARLEKEMDDWQGLLPQVDDILMLGLRLG